MIRAAKLLKKTIKDFLNIDTMGKSASIAFYSLFSLPAIVLVVFALTGRVLGEERAAQQFSSFLVDIMGSRNALLIQNIATSFERANAGFAAPALSFAALLFSGAIVISTLKRSLNSIWRVKAKHKKGSIFQLLLDRFLSMGMIIAFGLILVLSVIADTVLIFFTTRLSHLFPSNMIVLFNSANILISLGLITIVFSVLFKFLPDVALGWRDVLAGAAATTILFTIGKYVIGFYIVRTPFGSAYGTASSLVLLLIWIYYSATIILFGAELTRELYIDSGRSIEPKPNAVKIVIKEIEG